MPTRFPGYGFLGKWTAGGLTPETLSYAQPVGLRPIDPLNAPFAPHPGVPRSPATGLTADVHRNRGTMTEFRACLAGVSIDADILLQHVRPNGEDYPRLARLRTLKSDSSWSSASAAQPISGRQHPHSAWDRALAPRGLGMEVGVSPCATAETSGNAYVHGSSRPRNSTVPVPSSRISLARSSKFTLTGSLTERAPVAALTCSGEVAGRIQ